MAKGVSLREFSRIKGVTHGAVQKAVQTGRITPKKFEKKGGRIFYEFDPKIASRQWDENTDPSQQKVKTRREKNNPNNRRTEVGKSSSVKGNREGLTLRCHRREH